ncbi:hypothetical protein CF67_01015 [Candidatus Photodesmus blepharus]|uniref:HTH cro/C1-type domain-containing protein n=1 Tax=Candidatus Photodesmus blepharonis TaxID=1179155 RepID=A0A084CPF9_9GAMM|nr:RodZ domain-containing protein [Candidatus Photodesmus blepharus]KEY91688.1 hypothetical protein CF67_01015 [Candidatus Photodesmus blepharus]
MSNEQVVVSEEQKKVRPGTLLKVRRKELGLSQKQIADRLRLRLSVIKNIEENNFNFGQVFTFIRGYLRSYSKVVGLNESLVLNALDDCTDIKYQEYEMFSFSEKTRRERHDTRIMSLTWGISIVVISISVFWWWQNQQDDKDKPISISKNGELALQKVDENLNSTKNLELLSQVLSDGTIPSYSIENTTIKEVPIISEYDEEALIVSFQKDCWIQIKDSQNKVLSTGVKKAGQRLEIIGSLPFSVVLGVPEGVSMTFANESIDLSKYAVGTVARFTLP